MDDWLCKGLSLLVISTPEGLMHQAVASRVPWVSTRVGMHITLQGSCTMKDIPLGQNINSCVIYHFLAAIAHLENTRRHEESSYHRTR